MLSVSGAMHGVLVPITILSAGPKRLKFENRIKQVADEKFTDSAKPGWLILCIDESGWPLLFLESLHRQSPPLGSASS